MAPPLAAPRFHSAELSLRLRPQKVPCWRRSARPNDEEYYLIDAPESIGDGFSFSGGKYADGPSKSDEWLAQGGMVKAYAVYGNKGKAKDPIFGLTMGAGSQSSDDVFQAYSYCNVLPVVSDKYHAIAFHWLGFGFSDKPQPDYGFDYTLDEYTLSLESLINVIAPDKLSIVVQGYFAPIVVKYASEHQDKLNHLILVNPPDPLRASDKALTSNGSYMMKEDDAMVYLESMKNVLSSDSWKMKTTLCWGLRDHWLNYDEVEDLCGSPNHNILELPMAGHHVQGDRGEELGNLVKRISG